MAKYLSATAPLKRIRPFLFLAVSALLSGVHAGWVSPSGLGAVNGWTEGDNAIDGNTGTYASRTAESGWGQFIEFTTGAIYCDRIRVYADFGYNQVDSVEVGAYNGSWSQVFAGTVNDAAWSDLPFSPLTNVTMGRFRFNWKAGASLTFWLYEFEFWSGTPSVAPTLTTTGATSVNLTSAIMHGSCSSDGGSIGQFRFKYGLTTSYTDSTAWSGSIMTGQTFGTGVTGLASGTLYHYRAQLKNGAGTGSGGDRTFSTGAPSAGWISPTGFSDPAARWSNQVNAYDDQAGTYASYSHQVGETNWIEYLYLLFPSPFSFDSVRFYATSNARIDSIDIDSYDGAAWTDAYVGTFADQTWVTQYFSSRTVDRIRVRFRAVNTGEGFPMELFEMDCYKQDANAPTLAWTGETNYASDGLDPETGYSDTDFKYRVLYTDADNDGPAVIQVWIDRNGDGDYSDANEKINLSVASDAAAAQRDGDYTNGEIFSVTTEISYLAATAYSYRFFANDGVLDATGAPNTAINNKPVISAYPSGVTPVWSKSGIGRVNGGAITDNAIYVGTGGVGTQYLYKFNSSDGTAAWPGSGGYSTALWGDCRIPTYSYSSSISKYKVLFSAGTNVVCYRDDGNSATQLFAQDVGSTAGTPYPDPFDTSFYVACLNTISKRSMSDGSVLFNINATNVSTSADIVVVNDYVYSASTDGRIYSADAEDGTPLNVYSGIGGAAVNLPLMLIGDTLYVTPDDHKMYAVRIPLLSAVANFPVTIAGQNSGAMYRDSLKIYCASGTVVQCFPMSGGAADWTRDIGDIIQSGPIPFNNILYVGRNNGRYYALDAATGAIKSNWPYTSASGDATSGPWIDITNSHVIFGTTGGNLDGFNSP